MIIEFLRTMLLLSLFCGAFAITVFGFAALVAKIWLVLRVKWFTRTKSPYGYCEILLDEMTPKPNHFLIPLQTLDGVARTFMAAAKKYDKAGVGWKSLPKDQKTKDKYDEKALRHLIQAFSGEGVDEESGVDHRYHAIADLMIRMWLEVHDGTRDE